MNLWCPIQSWLNFNNFKLLAAVLISHFDSGNYFTCEALYSCADIANCFRIFISDIFWVFCFQIFVGIFFSLGISVLKPYADITNCFRIFISDIFKLFLGFFLLWNFSFVQTLPNCATLSWFGKPMNLWCPIQSWLKLQ